MPRSLGIAQVSWDCPGLLGLPRSFRMPRFFRIAQVFWHCPGLLALPRSLRIAQVFWDCRLSGGFISYTCRLPSHSFMEKPTLSDPIFNFQSPTATLVSIRLFWDPTNLDTRKPFRGECSHIKLGVSLSNSLLTRLKSVEQVHSAAGFAADCCHI